MKNNNEVGGKKKNIAVESLFVALIVGLLTTVVNFIPNENLQISVFWAVIILIVGYVFILPSASTISDALKVHTSVNREQLNYGRALDPEAHISMLKNLFCAQHSLVHRARDRAVVILAPVPKYSELIPDVENAQLPYLDECFRSDVEPMLHDLVEIFKGELPAGAKVWTGLRTRRSNGDYSTWLRAGNYSPNRAATSQPMKKDSSGVIFALRKHYAEKNICVMQTGQDDQGWDSNMQNNRYKEDRSVLMGSIMTKSWDEEQTKFTNYCQSWILCVNSDLSDCFKDYHISMLQAYVDNFSMLANLALRNAYWKIREEQSIDKKCA